MGLVHRHSFRTAHLTPITTRTVVRLAVVVTVAVALADGVESTSWQRRLVGILLTGASSTTCTESPPAGVDVTDSTQLNVSSAQLQAGSRRGSRRAMLRTYA